MQHNITSLLTPASSESQTQQTFFLHPGRIWSSSHGANFTLMFSFFKLILFSTWLSFILVPQAIRGALEKCTMCLERTKGSGEKLANAKEGSQNGLRVYDKRYNDLNMIFTVKYNTPYR
jgi:hypothetical protein